MIALDTNVLVRFLVKDDPLQTRKAKALVDGLDDDQKRAYVSDIVVCELIWVLARGYQFERKQIVETLRQLVAARQLQFSSGDNVIRALAAFEEGQGDFADYLIREQAKTAGCNTVKTFDKKLLREAMFSSP